MSKFINLFRRNQSHNLLSYSHNYEKDEATLAEDELEQLASGTQKRLDENLLDTMVPYADLMTLLLVFFVFFFIISDYERSKMMIKNQEIMQKINVDSLFDANEKVITIPSEILFESGKAELKWEAKKALSEIAENIKTIIASEPGWQIRVEGHTDNVPIFNNKFTSNWDLSTARALSVVKFFLKENYFLPDQLEAMGYGEFKPLVPNDTPEHRRKNRRVEIKLNKKYY
ncbi:MAG: hypothetical protein DRZ79_02850 [Candidatus Cloacimonadota bacterium]|nr:MAG: hypothetical protein DRZ79_02850 [Candidatus Cloacimonadota bacterium]